MRDLARVNGDWKILASQCPPADNQGHEGERDQAAVDVKNDDGCSVNTVPNKWRAAGR